MPRKKKTLGQTQNVVTALLIFCDCPLDSWDGHSSLPYSWQKGRLFISQLTSPFTGFSTFLPCADRQGRGHRSLSASPKQTPCVVENLRLHTRFSLSVLPYLTFRKILSPWGHWLDNFLHSFLSPLLYSSELELKVRKSKYLVDISGIGESFPLWKMGGFSYFIIP